MRLQASPAERFRPDTSCPVVRFLNVLQESACNPFICGPFDSRIVHLARIPARRFRNTALARRRKLVSTNTCALPQRTSSRQEEDRGDGQEPAHGAGVFDTQSGGTSIIDRLLENVPCTAGGGAVPSGSYGTAIAYVRCKRDNTTHASVKRSSVVPTTTACLLIH